MVTGRQEPDRRFAHAGTTPCPRCHRDIARLPSDARFCPRCGTTLPLIRHAPAWRTAVRGVTGPVAAVGRRLARWSHAEFEGPRPVHAGFTEAVRTAYASAMTGLGARYESSLSAYNLPEALRCYRKAARLGNPLAQQRLAARGADAFATAEKVPFAHLSSPGSPL